jgi:hypothetical protein
LPARGDHVDGDSDEDQSQAIYAPDPRDSAYAMVLRHHTTPINGGVLGEAEQLAILPNSFPHDITNDLEQRSIQLPRQATFRIRSWHV